MKMNISFPRIYCLLRIDDSKGLLIRSGNSVMISMRITIYFIFKDKKGFKNFEQLFFQLNS